MKKIILLCIISFFTLFCFGQTKIGTTNNENILEIYKFNNSLIYTYVEETNGLISILQDFYCNVNGKKIGPFSKQPIIKTNNNHYYIEVRNNDSFGIIIDDLYFGLYEDLEDLIFSEDGSKYCFKYTQNNTDYLCENGTTIIQKAYITEAAYGPDNHLFYCYSEIKEDDYPEIFVQTPDNVYGPFADIEDFNFTENNDYYIKVEDDDYDDYYLINGKIYNEDKYKTALEKFGFSTFKKDKEGLYYQQGEQRTPSFEKLEFPTLFPVNDNIILKAQKNSKSYVIKNFNIVYGPYPCEKVSSFHITPETNYLFYNVEENGEYHLYRDGEYIVSSTELIYPYTSANGKLSCFRIKNKEKKYWLSTGKEKIGPYDDIEDITISDDGTKIVYVGVNSKEKYVYEGIKKYGPFRYIYDIRLSFDNKLAFSYEDNEDNYFIFHNQKEYGPYQGINGHALNCNISKDGKHIAYNLDNYGKDNKKIIFDGKQIGTISEKEEYSFLFSKDSLHTVCYSFKTNILYYDGKKIEGNIHLLDDAFEDYGILAYDVKIDNKTIYHLLINGKDYKGCSLKDGFMYIDGIDIIYLKK